jgi:hypothetical protein
LGRNIVAGSPQKPKFRHQHLVQRYDRRHQVQRTPDSYTNQNSFELDIKIKTGIKLLRAMQEAFISKRIQLL